MATLEAGWVHQAYRYEMDPNNRTASRLFSHCGAARFAYNTMLAYVLWALDARAFERRTTRVAVTQVPWSLYSLRMVWNNEVKPWAAPWWTENFKEAYNSGLDALARALDGFSKSRRGVRQGRRVGFPRFKGKGARRSYRISTGSFGVLDSRHIKVPRIGAVRSKEPTTKLLDKIDAGSARILSAAISHEAGRWFVSFGCEVQRQESRSMHPGTVVGVDLSVHHLAVLSNGKPIANPKALGRYHRRMARLQRELSRRQKGSKGRARTKGSLARSHRRVSNVRSDALHKLTSELATTYGTVVVEDLAVAGMSTSAKGSGKWRGKAGLNRAVLDAAPGELRRQLAYKCDWHGSHLVVANRWYPSSKTCSRCKTVKAKLSLSERMFRCEHCDLVLDRDVNAARNLAALVTESGTGSGPGTSWVTPAHARGEERLQAGSHSGRCSSKNREDGTNSSEPGRTVTASSSGEAA